MILIVMFRRAPIQDIRISHRADRPVCDSLTQLPCGTLVSHVVELQAVFVDSIDLGRLIHLVLEVTWKQVVETRHWNHL
jgi:hypothetical protein